MPIHLKQEINNVSKVVKIDKILLNDSGRLMVWWYCGIIKNKNMDYQPNVLVALRELYDSSNLSDEVIYRRVPLTALGQVRIGTVWQNGLCQSELVLDEEVFAVDFTESNWKLTSFHQAAKDKTSPPYPREIHPLGYDRDRNWLLEFSA